MAQKAAAGFLNAAGIIVGLVWLVAATPMTATICAGPGRGGSGLPPFDDPRTWLVLACLAGGAPAGAGLMSFGELLSGRLRDVRPEMMEKRLLSEWVARWMLLWAACLLFANLAILFGARAPGSMPLAWLGLALGTLCAGIAVACGIAIRRGIALARGTMEPGTDAD